VIFVEVLDRRNQVTARTRLVGFPATIGRAYESEVLLDDRYVDPLHARLVLDGDGSMVLEDLGSRNGTRDASTGDPISRKVVQSGMVVRMGETRLRLVEPGHPVPAAVREPRGGTFAMALRRPALAWPVVLAGALVLAMSGWLANVDSEWATEMVAGVMAAMLLLALWAGAWAFASRIFTGQARFMAHLAVAVGTMTLLTVTGWMQGFLRFLWPGAPVWTLLGFVITAVVLMMMLHSHLSLTGALGSRARRLASGAVAILFAAVMHSDLLSDFGTFSGGLEYDGNLSPVGVSAAATVSLDELIDATSHIRTEVDSLALEK
jgi:hypothetical protein